MDFKKRNEDKGVGCGFVNVDEDYLATYQFELVSGRNFSKKMTSDADGAILNEAALYQMGFQNPEQAVGKMIETTFDYRLKVIGVIKDYHHTSLKKNYEPVVLFFQPGVLNYYSLKIDTHDLKRTIPRIRNLWADIFPGSPFDYFFMDDFFNAQYKTDQYFGKTTILFALLSIIVAALGLYGLSSYNLLQRKKEIGIRKVLGAGIGRILYQLSKEHLKLLLIANLVAIPLAYYISQLWLMNYAFQLQLGWQLFFIPASFVVLIAFITVCFQTIRAATTNPVESLRYE
jgi:putative ABC transport system permease protein